LLLSHLPAHHPQYLSNNSQQHTPGNPLLLLLLLLLPQGPCCATLTPAHRARHSLLYDLPSLPHTGRMFLLHRQAGFSALLLLLPLLLLLLLLVLVSRHGPSYCTSAPAHTAVHLLLNVFPPVEHTGM
jgi:hypothetical protein